MTSKNDSWLEREGKRLERAKSAAEATRTQQIEFAKKISAMISRVFLKAYSMRACGCSKDAMLIDYEISAAAVNQDKSITQVACNTIEAAVSAYEERVPFLAAHSHLMSRVDECIDELIAEQQEHAVDENKSKE